MFDFTGLADMKGWMKGAADSTPEASSTPEAPSAPSASSAPPALGVVISSRVRLSRNLSEYPYPGTLSAQEHRECQERILAVFRRLPNAGDLTVIGLDELSPLDRRILFERNVISQGYSLEKNRAMLLSGDGSLSAIIGDEDHLRLAAFGAGSCLETLFGRIDAIDTRLSAALPFAVSPEWGYLNTAITNLGTGLKASMMLHLPALSMGGLIKRAVKASAQLGLSIRGFYSESMESMGDMYLIANEITIGVAETEIIANLGGIAAQLAGYENRTREELMDKRRIDMEDRVMRAWGLLTHCRYLSLREAIESLSSLRLGIALGILGGVDASAITPLLFLVQKSHIQKVLQSRHDTIDTKLIDYTRAKLVREALPQERGG
jgi:protein arginine kinase